LRPNQIHWRASAIQYSISGMNKWPHQHGFSYKQAKDVPHKFNHIVKTSGGLSPSELDSLSIRFFYLTPLAVNIKLSMVGLLSIFLIKSRLNTYQVIASILYLMGQAIIGQ